MKLNRYVLKFPADQMSKFKNWCHPNNCYVDRDSALDHVFPGSFWEAMVFESYEQALHFKIGTKNEDLYIALQELTVEDSPCAP